uniref:Putative ribonuclease H-like domain-containing protein n=1 Tax=Tanacetum cinerariifolium TaxID=118510 RepID=A0A699GMG3_TANCI|nr:putative ribonuclease H-like domain-containing protein [Tanacetum cinerariifolium]
MLAIPDEHLLKFHACKDAKSLWEAIKNRFGGNKESKKMQKTILKQNYENFAASSQEGLDKAYDMFQKLISKLEIHDTLSMDDLYNSLKVYKSEIKGQSSSSSNSHNVAFVTSDNSSSTNEIVNTAHSVFAASSKDQASTASYADDVIFYFFTNQTNALQTKVEFYNCHKRGHFARECRAPWNQGNRNRDAPRRNALEDTFTTNALVVQDGIGGYDWSFQAKEGIINFALMAYTYQDKTDLGYDGQINKSNLNDIHVNESEVLDSVFDSHESDRNDNQVNDRFKKVLTKSGQVPVNAAEQSSRRAATSVSAARRVNTVATRPNVNDALPTTYSYFKTHSPIKRPFNQKSAAKTKNFNEKVNTARVNNVTTVGPKVVVSAAVGNRDNVVKHMTGNKSYLTDYQEIDGGFVAFGGNAKGGKITKKCKIRTGKLDFKDVYFVKELNFNLFSVSQMCDKKNSVLFIDTECVVLSHDFKLLDESQVLLKVPRNNNMYSFDLKNVVPLGGLTCLFANATLDESNLWHRRLGHINFKTMNKLIKGNLVRGIESQMDQKVKKIRCDNGTEFKNRIINEFCEIKGIRREFSVAGTPQQNDVAERKNRTLIEVAKTMLAYSKLPTTFWAEAVNTDCYVQNRVLVIKPHNKTPYVLFLGRKPALSFIRPFGCPVTILNTLDHLGKFDGNSDDGFFVGYSINSKAFRVFNTRTKFVEENLHINFLEYKPNVAGARPNWMFDIDTLTMSMNYQPIFAGNQTNGNAGTKANIDAGQVGKKTVSGPQYVLLPLLTSDSQGPKSSEDEVVDDAGKKGTDFPRKENGVQDPAKEGEKMIKRRMLKNKKRPLENNLNKNLKDCLVKGRMLTLTTLTTLILLVYQIMLLVLLLLLWIQEEKEPKGMSWKDTRIFSDAYDDEVKGAVADFNNLELSTVFKPKKVIQALTDPSWIETMQDELLLFRLQKVWKLVDLPKGKHAIRTKWVYRNKKDKRGIVVGNKERLVAQGHTQEEGIDFDKVFDLVARIEAIRLFLACASFMGFIVYQMDGKSAFLYGTIEEEVMQRHDRIFISQDKYVDDILKKFNFYSVKTTSTPIETNKALLKDEGTKDMDVHLYRSMIGSLMYLTASRPDIMLAICACARFQVTPKVSHLHAVKRIFRYLKGQPKLDLWYPKDSPFDLEAFSDSDYGGASLDRKSTTGGCQFLSKRLISWQYKKQTVVTNSTTKAEYVAAANCYRQVLWIQNQMLDYGFNFMNTKIYIDNESTICIVKNLVYHSKTKHIEIKHHFIRDSYEKRLIQVIKIHTYHNVADLLTKAFDVSSDEFRVKTGSCKVNAARHLKPIWKLHEDFCIK